MASQFSTYTTKELLKKVKKQKIMAIIHAVLLLMMLVFAIFSTLENGISFHTFLPLFFIPMEIVMLIDIKKLNQEIASRK